MKYVVWFIAIVIGVDMLGFLAWVLSGQFPVDNFYIGSITRNVLNLILQLWMKS